MTKQDLYKLLQECTVRLIISSGAIGTGFFISPGGWILTCDHVVDQADDVEVLWLRGENQLSFTAKVKLRIPHIDIALLQIEGKVPNHMCVYLDESLPHIGDDLYTFGYPQDYSENYSGGDSATIKYEGKSFQDNVLVFKLKEGQIQEGYSGSPLLNIRTSKVCGVITISRSTTFDLGGRATPINLLFQPKALLTLKEEQHLIVTILERNKNFHKHENKAWRKIVKQSFWDRKTALSLAAISLISFILIYLKAPDNQLTLAILRFVVAYSFGYTAHLAVKSLNLNVATASKFPISSLTGFLTTLLVFGLSFLMIPNKSIVVRNLTGINEYPTLGLIEKELPIPFRQALDIKKSPIVDTNNSIYESIQAFRDESGNSTLMSKYVKPSGISSAFNQDNSTMRKKLVGRREGEQEKIRQNLQEFESELSTFEGERQEFYYTSVLSPFQTSLEDATWTAFLPPNSRDVDPKDFKVGTLIQYPKLSDVNRNASFTYRSGNSNLDNTWLQKIIENNPENRGFLSFRYQYFTRIISDSSRLLLYLMPCTFEGIVRLAPTPYVRFVDIENNSFSSLKIDSVKVKILEKENYKLTSVFDRNKIFQEIPTKDDPLNISIPPGVHLLIPIEFGFDTRVSKNTRRLFIGNEAGNRNSQEFNTIDFINKSLYISKIPSTSLVNSGFRDININNLLKPITFSKNFIGKTQKMKDLFQAVPNRFAVGSLRNIIAVRINGKDVQIDNPLNNPRFSMSVYFAYGSCPYLMVYDSEKGYWMDLGTVITGRQSKAQKDYEVHSLGDHPSKFRIEERDKEITYLDSISILYTDSREGQEKELKSEIPELNTVDKKYFTLHQDDFLEINLKKLLPKTAINVRLKVNGYYEVLPGVTPIPVEAMLKNHQHSSEQILLN